VDGWVFVAGTTGYDYASMAMPSSMQDQCRNTLATIVEALKAVSSSLDHVVRVNYILPDGADWETCWPITSRAFASARPAAPMIRARLQNADLLI
jgi:enamine deaminase RidA (YjgF/YER057c/UK114 family)